MQTSEILTKQGMRESNSATIPRNPRIYKGFIGFIMITLITQVINHLF